jgi:hypothetical protein
MKDIFFLGLLATVGAVAVIYLVWALFIPMMVGQKVVEREVLKNSPQYVITQRQALTSLYKGYTDTDDVSRQEAIKGQMCQIIANLPSNEVPAYIKAEITCR